MDAQTITVPTQTGRRRRRGNRTVAPARGLLILVVALVTWQILGPIGGPFFPVPSAWFVALADLAQDGLLAPAAANTLSTFLTSLIIAVLLGSALGVIIGRSRTLERALTPMMDFFRTLPPPVVVPVTMIVLGPTYLAGVVIVVIAIVWPILLSTANAVRTVPDVRSDMGKTIGLSAVERFTKVLLPSLLPGIFVGTRVAVSVSLVVTLLVDILGSTGGLGGLIVQSQELFQPAAVWGLLLLIGVFGYLLNVLLGVIEGRLLRNWQQQK